MSEVSCIGIINSSLTLDYQQNVGRVAGVARGTSKFHDAVTDQAYHADRNSKGTVMRPARFVLLTLASLSAAGPEAMAQQAGTPDQARDLSDKAAAHVKAVGIGQAIADFNNPKGDYQYDELYVVVFDKDGLTICSPGIPALLNHDNKPNKDADGMEFGKALLSAPDGSWVSFRMTNPAVKRVEKKTSYVHHVGDLTLFVGAYSH